MELATKLYRNLPGLVFFVVSVIACLLKIGTSRLVPKDAFVPALFVFGDSYVDPGNNNHLISIAKCDYPPYGRDFKGSQPTGRFSNGKIPSDFMAQELGIKELLPAYLDPSVQIEDLLTGVSFASGGAGYDPLTSTLETAIPLMPQLQLFQIYVGSLNATVGEKITSAIVSNSIYLVCVGTNDIANAYYASGIRRIEFNFSSYSDLSVNYASQFLQELYNLGGRRIWILAVPPIGCLPSQRTLARGIDQGCVEEYNQATCMYNSKLRTTIQSLNTILHGAKLVYLDIYEQLLELIENPTRNGFLVANKGCCGARHTRQAYLCTRGDFNICEDANRYVFWDGFHLTEAAYKLLVHRLMNASIQHSS